jgi:RNA polymerase sigma factor (TIGR02999 family)
VDNVRSQVTLALRSLASSPDETGRNAARTRLFALLHDELREVAARMMQRERHGHSLAPTELVHEVYLRVVEEDAHQPTSRAHFVGVAARAMRQVLVDHARARAADKRGGGWQRVTFAEEADARGEAEVLELHEAMERLAGLDARAARVVELRVFGGLTVPEVAELLGVSPRTIDGDWVFARAWLTRELRGAR